MDLDKIEKLNELKEKGIITEEEFQKGKAQALEDKPVQSFDLSNMDSRNYSMIMHFSQFCCFVLPVLGWVVPLIMWLTKKDDDYIDQQGRVIFNWIISAFIYTIGCIILMVIVVGVFLLLALVVCSIIFTVMGAINAKDGVIRNYPLAIRFLAVNETPRVTVVK
ncbi:MAG TPA: DUF4870 domain-containing protein [Cellvibrio sp.]|nr:DUF4870 domain-containing protein [Cellvibrio sp.]